MTIFKKSFGHYVENVRPGLWRIVFHLPTSTNCWLYEDSDGLTLVDAGNYWNAGTINDTTLAIGKPLRRIVITHAHPDHAGSAALLSKLTGAAVYAHEADVPFLQGRKSIADLPGSVESQNLHKTARIIGILHPPSIDDLNTLVDGDQIGALKVLHTPGHTPGSISLWSDRQKALFVGDNASNRWKMLKTNLSWFTLNTAELKQSIQSYSAYPANMILPGHGDVYHSKDAVSDLLSAIKN
ncbi:MAG: MBL fold metallo-hydrolase [Candidatus Melainabacteria bacterium]|nr:MBL fold metallo-hydrolase [Candidatus Melainabacteria bacterium]